MKVKNIHGNFDQQVDFVVEGGRMMKRVGDKSGFTKRLPQTSKN